MTIKSYLHSSCLESGEGVLFEQIPDILASSIYGGSTIYDTNQQKCVNGKCHYDEERVVDGKTVHKYSGAKSPLERLIDSIGLNVDPPSVDPPSI